jgi:hypothetical protein
MSSQSGVVGKIFLKTIIPFDFFFFLANSPMDNGVEEKKSFLRIRTFFFCLFYQQQIVERNIQTDFYFIFFFVELLSWANCQH